RDGGVHVVGGDDAVAGDGVGPAAGADRAVAGDGPAPGDRVAAVYHRLAEALVPLAPCRHDACLLNLGRRHASTVVSEKIIRHGPSPFLYRRADTRGYQVLRSDSPNGFLFSSRKRK